jgi:AP2-associated kinase
MFDALSGYLFGETQYRIGAITVDVKEQLSEGGFAFIYRAVEATTGREFALKRINCQSAELKLMAEREVDLMRRLPQDENLVKFYEAAMVTEGGSDVMLILMELCSEGTLITLLERYEGRLNLAQILYVMKDVCRGVKILHKLGVAHRDLKVENILLSKKKFKLCDFGSWSDQRHDLSTLPASELQRLQEKFEGETTLMYRPPEMCDVYARQEVSTKVDVWMLGCILFTLAYFKHPFQNQNQLAIVNVHYFFPETDRFDDKFKQLVRYLLDPSPATRPDIDQVLAAIDNYHFLAEFGPINSVYTAARTMKKTKDRDLTDAEIAAEIAKIQRKREVYPEISHSIKPVARSQPPSQAPVPMTNIWASPIGLPQAPSQAATSSSWVSPLEVPKPKTEESKGWANF